jgi:hypothetical protein
VAISNQTFDLLLTDSRDYVVAYRILLSQLAFKIMKVISSKSG